MQIITHSVCPICFSKEIVYALTANDHFFSKENFEIWECRNCTGRFTQNIPASSAIGKYYNSTQYISHSDTQEGIINKLYHRVRTITLRQKQKLIEKINLTKKGKLLEIGAGTGLFANYMQKAGWDVIALEPDEVARKKAEDLGIQVQNLSELPDLQPEFFDVITLWHVLEHVHELHNYIDQFKKILKPGGNLIIAVPNFISADAKHYGTFWAAYDVPRHLYHFNPDAMKLLMHTHGFEVIKTYPQWFDSFYVSLLSEKYKSGKASLIKGGFSGLLSNLKASGNRNKCSSLIYQIQNQKSKI
ncbi:MAG TPA: class I SAM-dependent methyltransferase [Chitinophagaceae bacterium]|nr:class I SAM-dependent methyltransferase [Chitinophagaceae bacterium]